jgi:hypothetical protein
LVNNRAPPSSARPLHYRSSKAYVQGNPPINLLTNVLLLCHVQCMVGNLIEVLGVACGMAAGKERTKLYSLYTRTSHMILARVRACTPSDRDWVTLLQLYSSLHYHYAHLCAPSLRCIGSS